jgi:hypothetical protein
MNRKRTLLEMCLLLCWAVSVRGQNLPTSRRPEDVGLSSERLARITNFFQGEIDRGAIPGATFLGGRFRHLFLGGSARKIIRRDDGSDAL